MFALRNESQPGLAPVTGLHEAVLSHEAIIFLTKLAREFEPRRQQLLEARRVRQQQLDAGIMPDFLPQTAHIRQSDWKAAPIPADLMDRRVEITGPVDRKMIINALNSGASVFMADFEDSNSPTWQNVIEGQANLRDAVRGVIGYTSPEGKQYAVGECPAVLMVRPRGWHLEEKHFLVDGRPISASLFDFGLFFFHNARTLIENGTGPYFYLPKLESHMEARLWNQVFVRSQEELGISTGTIRATVLIETILAAFEMDEILWELREHSSGLNCGPGTTSSASSRSSATTRISCCRIARWSPWTGTSWIPMCGCSSLPVTAAAFMPWAVWPRRFRLRTTPRPTMRRWTRCGRTSSARPSPATTVHGWRIRAWCRWRATSSIRTCRFPIRSTGNPKLA
jgi:hypothetical protein